MVFLIFISNVYSKDFENEYRLCTLIEENGNSIDERRAKSIDEYERKLFINETELRFDKDEFFIFGYEYTNKDGHDIYKILNTYAYLDKNRNKFFKFDTYNNDTYIYKCRKPSFFEKAKMFYDYNID